MKEDTGDIGYTESSGNVFADLGLAHAEELQAKAELAHQIGCIIEERRLTQAEAADLLGIDQPKVSALVRGRLSGFSMERLYRCLNRLGHDVEIVVKRAPRTRGHARTRVVRPVRAATAATRKSRSARKAAPPTTGKAASS